MVTTFAPTKMRAVIWGGAAALLLLPALAMQVSREVRWSGFDFALFAALLLAGCGAWEIGTRLGRSPAYRAGVAVAALAGISLIWVNLAVGMLGSEDNPHNLMFVGVLGTALAGAAAVRLRPGGMEQVMRVTAAAQAGVAVVALILGYGFAAALTLIWSGLWLAAAALFGKAARAGG